MVWKWRGILFLKLEGDLFYYVDWVRRVWVFIGVNGNVSDYGLEM